MDLIGNILYDTVYHSAPIILCVIGGVFAFKANVLNIALEGMMLIGAFVSTLVGFFTGNLILACALAVLASFALGLIFSFMGVTLKGNVIVIGLAINMLAPAIAGFVMVLMRTSNITIPGLNVADLQINIPVIGQIPIVGDILSGHPILTYVAFIGIALMWALMYKTRFGTYVRVVGENEDAARSLGLKANTYKYAAILIGAVCCGLAGVNLSTERMGMFTNNMTASRGFIAIAAIYCGRGKPLASSMYAVLFSLANALAEYYSLRVSASLLLKVVPYVVMVAVLSIASIVNRRKVRVRGAFSEQ